MNAPFDLRDGLGYQLTIAARTNNASFDATLSTIGLTRQMWCVLVAVGEQNITTPSAIADYIGIIRAATSRTLKQMERADLLHRSTRKTDKRGTTVVLTSKGQNLLSQSLPHAFQTRATLNAALSADEQHTLSRLLTKVTQSLSTTAAGV